MKKAIKRITIISTLTALCFTIKYFVFDEKKLIFEDKKSYAYKDETNEVSENSQSIYDKSTASNSQGTEKLDATVYSNNSSNTQQSSTNFGSNNEIANNNKRSINDENSEESYKDAVASNYNSNSNGFSSFNSNGFDGYSSMSGPNAGESNISGSVGSEVSASSSVNGNTAGRPSANTSSNQSAGRPTSGAGSAGSVGTISFNPPPVIETPGSPGGGSDPYVPIDDYYGLFALLICGGFVFWYRNKTSKLVAVKA